MPVIASADRVALGYEAQLYIGGRAMHQSTTDITLTHDLVTAQTRPIGQRRETIVHLAETSGVDIRGYSMDPDDGQDAIRDDWLTPQHVQVVLWGEVGLEIGHRVTFLPAVGQTWTPTADRDSLQTIAATGTQSGRTLAHEHLESQTLRQGHPSLHDRVRSVGHERGWDASPHTIIDVGETDHYFVLFSTGAGAQGAIPSDATHVGLIAGLTGISGFGSFSPALSRWRAGLVHNVTQDSIKPLTPWRPLGLTPTFQVCVASITRRAANEFYGFQVELVPQRGQSAPNRYSIALRGTLAYSHA